MIRRGLLTAGAAAILALLLACYPEGRPEKHRRDIPEPPAPTDPRVR